MKFKHPNEDQFMEENSMGISKLTIIANDAIKLFNEFRDTNERRYIENINEDKFKDLMFPETINALEKYKPECLLPALTVDRFSNDLARIHIYGNYKIGDRSKYDIYEDIMNHMKYDEVLNTKVFDMNSVIQVGFNISPLKSSALDLVTVQPFCIDVNTTLVRYMKSEEYIKHEAEVNNSILQTIFNKVLMFAILAKDYERVLSEYVDVDTRVFDNMGTNVGAMDTTDIRCIIKALYIYKIWYNIVNRLDESSFEESIGNIMDLIDQMSRTFNYTQAIRDSYNMIHSKLIIGVYDEPRYPDRYIEKAFRRYQQAITTYFKTASGRIAGNFNHYGKYTVKVGVESLAANTLLDSIGFNRNIKNEINSQKAIMTMIGAENVQAATKEFDDYKRKTRGSIIARLNPKERSTYLRLESDVIRLRAQAINVNTTFAQQTVLKRAEAVGKLLVFEMNSSTNEDFITMLSVLDTERFAIQTELANRDIFKERNSRLYGQQITRNNWDY